MTKIPRNYKCIFHADLMVCDVLGRFRTKQNFTRFLYDGEIQFFLPSVSEGALSQTCILHAYGVLQTITTNEMCALSKTTTNQSTCLDSSSMKRCPLMPFVFPMTFSTLGLWNSITEAHSPATYFASKFTIANMLSGVKNHGQAFWTVEK